VSWAALLAWQAFPSAFGGAGGLIVPQALPAGAHYELALGLVALAALGFWLLSRSPVGRQLAASRAAPAAATAAGVPVTALRVRAFGLGGMLAGLAGALGADLAGVADPSAYGYALSVQLLLAVVIGGAASALGGPVGVALLGLVTLVGGRAAGFDDELATRLQTVFAALIVLLLLPDDPDGLLPALARRLPRRRASAPAAAAPLPPRAPAAPLRATGLVKRYGAVTVLDGVDLSLAPGAIAALIGPNGSGKTTALGVLAGAVRPDAGRVVLGERDVTAESVPERVRLGVVRTLQAPVAIPGLTVLDHALAGAAARARYGGFSRALGATPRQRTEAAALRAAALAALDAAGLAPLAGGPAEALAVTDQRLLAIAAAAASDAAVLLLDEPAAGLGAGDLARLAAVLRDLRDRGLAILLVEHNLRFVQEVAERVTVLDAGRVIAAGPPAEIARDPQVRSVYLGVRSLA
jgi:branched-chain amino acid transport system permease protein